MITLKQHIDLMQHLSRGNTPEQYVETLKPLDKIDFLRDSKNTYPIQDNIGSYDTIKVSKNVYTDINSLVLGQFIMLEQIITGKTKLPDHLVDLEIAKLIIRPQHHYEFDNNSAEDERKNQEDILSFPVLEVYSILESFIQNRNQILFKDFSGVFYDAVDEDIEEEENVQEKTAEMLFGQQWYWYSIVRMLAGEDITKYEEIYMLPMSVVLPEMSYLAQKGKIDSARERERQAMRKL